MAHLRLKLPPLYPCQSRYQRKLTEAFRNGEVRREALGKEDNRGRRDIRVCPSNCLSPHERIYEPELLITLHRIGYGAASAFIDAGAHVTVISSNQDRVNDAVKRLDSPNASGQVGNVRDEESFIEMLRSLAPVDHIVFSGVDKIIRGKLEELDLDDAKYLFGVKFWGAVIVGKGFHPPFFSMSRNCSKH